MADPLKDKVLSGLVWRGLERFGTQAIQFAISIILARLLAPSDFGTVAIIMVFIALADVFVDSGFGAALIQKKDADARDFNSVFFLNLTVSVTLYSMLFLSAPMIAQFYSEPLLVNLLRLSAVCLILGALNCTQYALLTRKMDFKRTFQISLISTVVYGTVGIGMAYGGYGIWSLVFSRLASQIAATVALWSLVEWRPALIFSLLSIRGLFGFGSKLLCTSLIGTIFGNLYTVIIGKLFNIELLGHYSRGQSVPGMLMDTVQSTLSSVMFPAYAACQSDPERIKGIMRRTIQTSCLLVFPMMVGLAAISDSFVRVVLTDKWIPCVFFLQLACFSFAFFPIHVANLQVLNALGRSDLYLWLEVLKKSLLIASVLATYRAGIYSMVIAGALLSPVYVLLNGWPNRRLIDYSPLQQCIDVLPIAALSLLMGTCVFWISHFTALDIFGLSTQVVLGIIVYVVGVIVFRLECAEYAWPILHRFLRGKWDTLSVP